MILVRRTHPENKLFIVKDNKGLVELLSDVTLGALEDKHRPYGMLYEEIDSIWKLAYNMGLGVYYKPIDFEGLLTVQQKLRKAILESGIKGLSSVRITGHLGIKVEFKDNRSEDFVCPFSYCDFVNKVGDIFLGETKKEKYEQRNESDDHRAGVDSVGNGDNNSDVCQVTEGTHQEENLPEASYGSTLAEAIKKANKEREGEVQD